jgi:hypothetical protein
LWGHLTVALATVTRGDLHPILDKVFRKLWIYRYISLSWDSHNDPNDGTYFSLIPRVRTIETRGHPLPQSPCCGTWHGWGRYNSAYRGTHQPTLALPQAESIHYFPVLSLCICFIMLGISFYPNLLRDFIISRGGEYVQFCKCSSLFVEKMWNLFFFWSNRKWY